MSFILLRKEKKKKSVLNNIFLNDAKNNSRKDLSFDAFAIYYLLFIYLFIHFL